MTPQELRNACESLNPSGCDFLIDLRTQQINYLTKNFFPLNAEPTVSNLIHLIQLDINNLLTLKNNLLTLPPLPHISVNLP